MTFRTIKEAIDHIEKAMKASDDFLTGGNSGMDGKGKLPERWYDHGPKGNVMGKLRDEKFLQVLHMKGLSSLASRIFFNELCHLHGFRYLEVGTYTGSSLIASTYRNPLARAVGIDDFSMDSNAKTKLQANLKFFQSELMNSSNRQPEIIEAEAFSMDKSKLGEFDIYFYDGHHSADSQEKGLTCFFDNLAPISIVIVDDYSVFRVQQGTIRAIDKIGCKQHLRYAWTLPGGKGFEHLYWGGLGVMVFEK